MAKKDAEFHDEVSCFSDDGFNLGRDINKLWIAHESSLSEATVFYAVRILEAMSRAVLKTVGLDVRDNTYANLVKMASYGLTPQHTLYWAHGLRRLGNALRHANKEASPEEEEIAVAFLEYWLRWYFCRFQFGPCLAFLSKRGDVPPLIWSPWLNGILGDIESGSLDSVDIAEGILSNSPSYADIVSVPAIIAVLVEKLLESGFIQPAHDLLAEVNHRYPDDLRLLQLKGLCHSRANQLDIAVEHLEPLYKRYQNDDEMIGIMAGVYKRVWKARGGDESYLKKSHAAYDAGWRRDRRNTYLGINAATTLLLLGNGPQAEEIAREVRETLVERRSKLTKRGTLPDASLNLWDMLTFAEAEFLLGDQKAARGLFQTAKSKHPSAKGNLDTCLNQLRMIRDCMGSDTGDAGWLDEA